MYEFFVRWDEKKVAAVERWLLAEGRNVKANRYNKPVWTTGSVCVDLDQKNPQSS